MDPTIDIQGRESPPHRSFSGREFSIKVAFVLSMSAALALSYELFQLSRDPTPALTVSGSTEYETETSKALQFSLLDQPVVLPEFRFFDGDARPLSLHDFLGRPILLNIWATWCVPCRKEMPSLDRLQAKFDPSQFLVLTLSIDRQGVSAVKQFYQELGLKSLGIYVDQSGAAMNLLRVPGLPTTVLVNGDGREIGRKIGPAEWDSPQTVALLRQHLRLPAAEVSLETPK